MEAQEICFLSASELASAYRRKAGYEEAALRRHFGAEWEAYTATVPAVLPRRQRSVSRPGGTA